MQCIYTASIKQRCNKIYRILIQTNALSTAITTVTTYAGADCILIGGEQLHRSAFWIQLIKHSIFIQTVALLITRQHQNVVVPWQNLSNRPLSCRKNFAMLSGFTVICIYPFLIYGFARIALTCVIHNLMIIRKLYVIYIADVFTDAYNFCIMLPIQKQAVALLIRIPPAISIKGQLIQNLIVLHVLLFLKDFFLLFGIHFIHTGIR